MFKSPKLYSILHSKCPNCLKGNMFLTKNPYSFSNIDKMPEKCPVCEQKFFPEPGFYYGAMYVSYALTIALSVAVFVAMIALWKFDMLWYLSINSSIIIILFPPIFRTSRVIWANFFIHHVKR